VEGAVGAAAVADVVVGDEDGIDEDCECEGG
jgi:hypothetical protein